MVSSSSRPGPVAVPSMPESWHSRMVGVALCAGRLEAHESSRTRVVAPLPWLFLCCGHTHAMFRGPMAMQGVLRAIESR